MGRFPFHHEHFKVKRIHWPMNFGLQQNIHLPICSDFLSTTVRLTIHEPMSTTEFLSTTDHYNVLNLPKLAQTNPYLLP